MESKRRIKLAKRRPGRTEFVMIRLRPDEKQECQAAANDADADSLSTWVRSLIKERLTERGRAVA